MSRYANDMYMAPTTRQAQQSDDRKRGSAHYADVYNAPNHIGAEHPPSPTRNTGRAVEVPMQPVQSQQRMVPVGPSRPPLANSALANRGPPNGTGRPPSYSGPPSEERLDNKIDPANQRQERRRGYRRNDDLGDEWEQPVGSLQPKTGRPAPTPTANYGAGSVPNPSQSSPRGGGNAPRLEPEIQKPVSPMKPTESLASGTTIPRLNSPSIISSVLQPLDKKVKEYDSQMNEAQAQMTHLDAEMAALQDRRREAENRYMAAKAKHDDYRRQYQGVERAMRGEPEPFSRLSFDDAESDHERPSTQQTTRTLPQQNQQSPGANSSRTESWGSLKKSKNDSRFRLSKLFGSS